MSEAPISAVSLQLALSILDAHCRATLNVIHGDVFEVFQDVASHLENEIRTGNPSHPPHVLEDLRVIADLFRSVGK